MQFFFEVLFGGLLSGIMYSLVALGFVLIFKASGVFNFAQGAMVYFAALSVVGCMEKGAPLWLALILAFGPCFQLPVVMTLLGLANLISSKVMAKGRRYAIVAVVVVAAVVTPPDPISQLMLAVPMVLLYEVSIWCVRIIEMRKKKAERKAD